MADLCSDIDNALDQLSNAVDEANKQNSECSVATYIIITDKGKIKWDGPFEILKELMVKLTGQDTSWISPSGDCKRLELSEVEVKWYANSKSLTISGAKKEEIKSKLRVLSNLVNLESRNSTECDGREALKSSKSRSDSLMSKCWLMLFGISKKTVNQELSNFRSEIRDLKLNSQSDKTWREEYVNDCTREYLLKENTSLKEHNKNLIDELNNYKCISSDLNMRVKDLENQNRSLTTVNCQIVKQ